MAISSTISHAEATAADGEQRNDPKPRGHPHNKATYRENGPQREPETEGDTYAAEKLPSNKAKDQGHNPGRQASADEETLDAELDKSQRKQKLSSS